MTGNKKEIGHFVKCMSWLDDNGTSQVHLLDLDASEDTAKDCVRAIHASAKKLCLNDRTTKFNI